MPVCRLCLTVLITALAAVQVQPAFAAFGYGISGTSGVNLVLPPTIPANVFPGSHQSNTPIIFPEIIGGVLTANTRVDHDGSQVVAQPTVSGNLVNPALLDDVLAAGTLFNSYMFHFDPIGAPFFKYYLSNISFDHKIIGVQLFSNGFVLQKNALPYTGTLEFGDAQVIANGGPGPTGPIPGYYPGGNAFRGVEEDAFVLAIAGNTIMLGGSVSGAEIDQIRIFTATPEAASFMTWAIISLIGYSGAFLRRRR